MSIGPLAPKSSPLLSPVPKQVVYRPRLVVYIFPIKCDLLSRHADPSDQSFNMAPYLHTDDAQDVHRGQHLRHLCRDGQSPQVCVSIDLND